MGLLYKSEFALAGSSKKIKEPFGSEDENKIRDFILKHINVRCYIFDYPEKAGRIDAAIYSQMIKNAVAALGLGIELYSKKVLVLFPDNEDGELISHHLFMYFRITEQQSFPAADAETIKERLKNL